MSYNFETTNKKFYFARDGDLVYYSREKFLLKLKPIRAIDSKEKPIVSFVVSRKVGNSVERNLLKRRLRVIFNDLAIEKLRREFAHILILRKGVIELSFEILQNEIMESVQWCMSQRKFISYVDKQQKLIHREITHSIETSAI